MGAEGLELSGFGTAWQSPFGTAMENAFHQLAPEAFDPFGRFVALIVVLDESTDYENLPGGFGGSFILSQDLQAYRGFRDFWLGQGLIIKLGFMLPDRADTVFGDGGNPSAFDDTVGGSNSNTFPDDIVDAKAIVPRPVSLESWVEMFDALRVSAGGANPGSVRGILDDSGSVSISQDLAAGIVEFFGAPGIPGYLQQTFPRQWTPDEFGAFVKWDAISVQLNERWVPPTSTALRQASQQVHARLVADGLLP